VAGASPTRAPPRATAWAAVAPVPAVNGVLLHASEPPRKAVPKTLRKAVNRVAAIQQVSERCQAEIGTLKKR